MSTDTATVLSDLLLAAIDDTRIRVTPRDQRRLLERMVELAEIAGVEIVIAHPVSTRENQPKEKP